MASSSLQPGATEIIGDRTANSRTWANPDGSFTAQTGTNLNYKDASGNFDPVNLSFAPTAGGFIENHSASTVKISALGADAVNSATGKGIRFLTPSEPNVSGTFAATVLSGASWDFVPTSAGLEFSTVVSKPQGQKSYTFAYQLLGGAKALSVNAAGDLTSDAFVVSRPTVVEADGQPAAAGSWDVVSASQVAFSFNDAALPPAAYPYILDPNLNDGVSQAESFVAYSSSSYPPPAPASGYGGSTWLLAADDYATGQYGESDQVMDFNTSTIPANAIPTFSSLDIITCYMANTNSGWGVDASWVTGAINPSVMYPPAGPVNAAGPFLLGYQFPNPGNPVGCVQGTAGGLDENLVLGSLYGTEFNATGNTELQMWVSNRGSYPSSSLPTSYNFVYWAGTANGSNAGPVLSLTYHLPPAAPSSPSVAPSHSLTPTLSFNGATDPDGDQVYYAYFVDTPTGSPVWGYGWTPSTSATIGAGSLSWNASYIWSACSWDEKDPTASIQCFPWQSFSPVNHAPPIPTQLSPTNTATVLSSAPTLVASSVTDPDADPVSYQFQVTSGPNGTGTSYGTSSWLSSPSWSVPTSLIDGTYYWRVQSQDIYGASLGWSGSLSFFVALPPPAPSVTFTVAQRNPWITTTAVSLSWSDAGDPSGIKGYGYVSGTLDQNPSETPTATSPFTAGTSVTVTAGGPGAWYFHIAAENNAGVWSQTTDFAVYVINPPACTSQPPPAACTPSSDATGLENFYPYSPFDLGNGTAYANMATGNLAVQYTDFSVPGQGLNLNLTRTYNATRDSIDGPLGKGWTLGVESATPGSGSNTTSSDSGLGQLLGLNVTATVASTPSVIFTFVDDDGTTHTFVNIVGTWESPPGVDLTLTQTQDPSSPFPTYYLTRPDGVYYEFQVVGLSNYELTLISNRAHTAQLCFNYLSTLVAPLCTSASANDLQILLQNLLNLGQPNPVTPVLQSITSMRPGSTPGSLIVDQTLAFSWSSGHISSVTYSSSNSNLTLTDNYNVDPASDRLLSVTQAAGTQSFGGASTARTTSYGYGVGASSFGLNGVTNTVITPGLANSSTATGFLYEPTQTVVSATTTTPALAAVVDRASQRWNLSYGGPSCVAPVQGNPICLTDPETPANTQVWTTNASLNLVDLEDAGDVDANGHPRLNQTRYTWGMGPTANLLVSQTDASGDQTSYGYNNLDEITQTVYTGIGVAPLTTTLRYQTSTASYQPANVAGAIGDLVEEDVGAGTPQVRATTFVVNTATGSLTSETSPGENDGPTTTRFSYYANSLLESVTDPDNNVTTYGYPVTGAAANDYGYDVSGQPMEITDALAHAETLGYDYLGNQVTMTDRTGATSTTYYDAFGNVVEAVSALGEATYSCYDTDANAVLSVNALAPASVIGSNPCALVGTDGYSTRTYYNARDNASSTVTESDGQLSKTTDLYHPNGSLQGTIEPQSYDANGNLLPTGQVAQVTATYYPDQRLAMSTDELGATQTATYTPIGQIATQTAPPNDNGQDRTVTTNTYNGWGAASSSVSGVSGTTTVGYDLFGKVTATTTPGGNTTRTGYWPSGAVETTTAPNQTTSTTDYDAAGNTVSLVQPTGTGQHTSVTYTYTALNQIATENDPADAPHLITYAYDNDGRQTDRYDLESGVTQTTQALAYDVDGRQVSSTATSIKPGQLPFATADFFDAAGDVTQTSSSLAGNPVSTIATAYTAGGQPKVMNETLSPPAGTFGSPITEQSVNDYNNDGTLAAFGFAGVTNTYRYRLNGEESTTTDPSSSTPFASTYNPDGSLAAEALPDGALNSQTYDAASRLSSEALASSSGVTLTAYTNMTYDPDSNLLSETVTQEAAQLVSLLGIPSKNIVNPTTYQGTESLGYDANDRMTSFEGPVDTSTANYSLDDAGNVSTTAETIFNYNENRLMTSVTDGVTTTFGYDDAGNQISASGAGQITMTAYDAAFHTEQVTVPSGVTATYQYDAIGRLAVVADSAGVHYFFHDGTSETTAEEVDTTSSLGVVSSSTIRYILDSSGDVLGQVAALPGGPGPVPTYDVTDSRSDVVQVLDTSANVLSTYGYDPFGNPKSAQDSVATASNSETGSALQFQGAQKDPTTGEYALGDRLYSPQIDRFVGADLYAAAAAGIQTQEDPLTGNEYLYAGANPAGLVDDGYAPSNPNPANFPIYCQKPTPLVTCIPTPDKYSTEKRAENDVANSYGKDATTRQKYFPTPPLGGGRFVDVYVLPNNGRTSLAIEIKIGRTNNQDLVPMQIRKDYLLRARGDVGAVEWWFFPNSSGATGPSLDLQYDLTVAGRIPIIVYYNHNHDQKGIEGLVAATGGAIVKGASEAWSGIQEGAKVANEGANAVCEEVCPYAG